MFRVGLATMVALFVFAACEQTTDFPPEEKSEMVANDGVSDGGADLTPPTPDLPEPDLVTPDVPPPGCEPGSGCFGEPCQESDDCLSGLCGQHLGDGVCTETCEDACPEGWSCKQVVQSGGDPIYICVSDFTHLCRPCAQTSDCASDESEEACVDYGHEGWFCGAACDDENPCPAGFACEERDTAGGGASDQCVAVDGVCPCSETASNLGLSTPCAVENEHGVCAGVRACGADGLGACDAATPSEELCNGIDDDCDGTVDLDTCDDGNPCTTDTCLGADGCSFEPVDGGACSDESVCTDGDQCVGGVCVGEAVVCDDENVCTDDGCDPVEGCIHTPNFADCSDGEACTHGDACKDGVCAPGATLVCDDSNPCTDDLCDEDQGCLFVDNDAGCDDGNACTSGDACVEGVCLGAAATDCDDENACTHDSCEPSTGCTNTPHTLPCNDNDVCSLGDHCLDGACQAGSSELICDDGNPCTTDSCDASAGCVFAPNAQACDDGSDCTVGDVCSGGACVGTGQLNCDDGNPCTHDACLGDGGCEHTPTEGPCFDGDLCTVGDQCEAGSCVGGESQSCDDGNPCTDDACSAAGLCVHTPNEAPCDDGNACTSADQCGGAVCLGAQATDCSDGNPCTLDGCSPLSGCSHEEHAGPCDDGDACTAGDACVAGACVSGTPILCDDYNPCTENLCDGETGCAFPPWDQPCDDGDPCSAVDQCVEGACVGSGAPDCDDGNPCTDDGCEASQGCVHEPNALSCDDGDACTTVDVCIGGSCAGSGQLECDDQDVCTDDVCEPATGCIHPFNVADCDDASACTLVDVCDAGVCVGHDPPDCDDQDPCTDDGCDASQGCTQTHNTAACDDQDTCTIGDTCDGGVCLGNGALDCSDGNACTEDLCDPVEGCSNPYQDGDCDDGNACTAGQDTCSDGVCLGGTPLICDDGNPCTQDQCDEEVGCQFPPVEDSAPGGCSDGDPCTEGDFCAGSQCFGTPVGVDAPGALTGPSDVCDGEEGVVHQADGVAGATEYIWTVPAGVTITSGQGTTILTTTWSEGASGEVSVVAKNACAESAPVAKAVVTEGCLEAGLIVGWSGSLYEIPIGWNICDGSGSTPDLRDSFVKGAPEGMLAGIGGGSDSAHDHGGLPSATLTTGSVNPSGRSCGGNSCTWKAYAENHSHSYEHEHTIDSTSAMPPYFELLFIQNVSASSLPVGAITATHDGEATVPAGWSACDGLGETPDLRGRFLRGAGWGESSGEIGGSETHSHGNSDTKTTTGSFDNGKSTVGCFGPSATDGNHSHGYNHHHTVDPANHLPPYMNLAFYHADQTGPAPAGHIVFWAGDLGAIPAGWALCDGENNTPDLQGRYPRGVPAEEAVGDTGGSLEHTHSSSSDPGGLSASSTGGNGNCSNGSPYMAFHTHSVNGHQHPETASESNEPSYRTLYAIMKL